jgi:hypothetical protein
MHQFSSQLYHTQWSKTNLVHPRTQDCLAYLPKRDEPLPLHPPASAHPAECFKGTVFGFTPRYYAQNTFHGDYIHFIKLLLYHCLIRRGRGWDRSKMRKMILDVCSTVECQNKTLTAPTILNHALRVEDEDKNRLFIHFTYHPEDIPRK